MVSPVRLAKGVHSTVRSVLVAALLASATVACTDAPDPVPATSPLSAEHDRDDVTVTGPVRAALGSNLVLVGDHGAEEVLVVIPDGLEPLRMGEYVEASGQVVTFELETMAIDQADEGPALGAWDGQPCLLASRVRQVASR